MLLAMMRRLLEEVQLQRLRSTASRHWPIETTFLFLKDAIGSTVNLVFRPRAHIEIQSAPGMTSRTRCCLCCFLRPAYVYEQISSNNSNKVSQQYISTGVASWSPYWLFSIPIRWSFFKVYHTQRCCYQLYTRYAPTIVKAVDRSLQTRSTT
jgi:hypothetical protein